MGEWEVLGDNIYHLAIFTCSPVSPSIKMRAQMLAGACKQKPPSFLILLFVPKSGFLKDWLSHQPLPGSRSCFSVSRMKRTFLINNRTVFSGLKKFKIPALDKNRTQSSDKSEFTDT